MAQNVPVQGSDISPTAADFVRGDDELSSPAVQSFHDIMNNNCRHGNTQRRSHYSHLRYSDDRQNKCRQHGRAHDYPSSPVNLCIRQLMHRVPRQMSQPVEAVVGERQRRNQLDADLGDEGPLCETGRHRGAGELQTEERCREIADAEEVHAPGQHDGSHAVEPGPDPGDLGLVDAQMRRHGAVETLVREDLRRIRLGDVRSGWSGLGSCGGGVAAIVMSEGSNEHPLRFSDGLEADIP